MKRMHVMLRVRDLEEAVRFYSALFGANPTTKKPDYARWMLDDPRVNFSIAESADEFGIEHLGIQADTPAEMEELRERIARAGGTVYDEGETTCCYAHSDKTWVVDQQGVSWEAFYTSGAAETYAAGPQACCPAETQAGGAMACCSEETYAAGPTAAACCPASLGR